MYLLCVIRRVRTVELGKANKTIVPAAGGAPGRK
jgi:hypothetical protein